MRTYLEMPSENVLLAKCEIVSMEKLFGPSYANLNKIECAFEPLVLAGSNSFLWTMLSVFGIMLLVVSTFLVKHEVEIRV